MRKSIIKWLKSLLGQYLVYALPPVIVFGSLIIFSGFLPYYVAVPLTFAIAIIVLYVLVKYAKWQ